MLPNISQYSDELSAATDATVQSHITRSPTNNGGISLVTWMAKAGLYLSPWWSPTRDVELRSFWKKTDYLAGAVYTMTSRMTAIPFKVLARDASNPVHNAEADQMTRYLRASAQFGEGWVSYFQRIVQDLITQDNGAFTEIIGPGRKSGPLTGMPISFAHMDAARCQRTGNPEFPVVYHDDDGRLFKLHYTRVIMLSQMTSSISNMNGVGFCAVSRCANIAQNLLDIITYKQEKLGSRPHRAILITRGGLDPHDIQSAFQLAENSMNDQGLSRYSKIVVAGSSTLEDAGLDVVELSQLPDGFNENDSVTLGMATIALAFGLDAGELFPRIGGAATRADALLQHLKQRGKGPGQIIEIIERAFNHKYLPPHLQFVFDYQDDAQDRQVAEIAKIRADRRAVDMNSGVLDKRTAREQMLTSGDIDRSQFRHMELIEGRTENGVDLLSLFYSKQQPYKKLLDIGLEDPLNVFLISDLHGVIDAVYDKTREVSGLLVNNIEDHDLWWQYFECYAALMHLRHKYLHLLPPDDPYANVEEADHDMRMLNIMEHFIEESHSTNGAGRPTGSPSDGDSLLGGNRRLANDSRVRRQGPAYVDPSLGTNPRDLTKPRADDMEQGEG